MAIWRYIRDESLLAPIAALVILTTLLVSPVGDFPLNDDWIFAGAVQDILETGVYAGHPVSDPLFLVQAYWGALFCTVFGFSFTVLRISSLVALMIAAWGAALTAKASGCRRDLSVLMGVLLIANPLVLNLSYTFMTDGPFLALAHMSMYVFVRALRSLNPVTLLLASALACAAYLVRQFGVLIPLAFLCTAAVLRLRGRAAWNWKHALALILPWIGVFVVVSLLPDSARGLSPGLDLNRLGSTWFGRANNGIRHIIVQFSYLSLFLLPLIVFVAPVRIRESLPTSKKVRVALALAILWIVTVLFMPQLKSMPYLGNMLYDLGVGPMLMRGNIVDGSLITPIHIGNVWWIVTFACLLGSVLLIGTLFEKSAYPVFQRGESHTSDLDAPRQFLGLLVCAYVGVLFFPGLAIIYDRYTIMALAPLGILVLSGMNPGIIPTRAAFAVCACLYLFSVVALQDYMAWNTARWEASAQVQEEYDAKPGDIDGGYEYNGWVLSPQYLENHLPGSRINYGPKGGWIVRDNYAISFVPRENFKVIEKVPYYSWLGFTERNILILERTADDESF